MTNTLISGVLLLLLLIAQPIASWAQGAISVRTRGMIPFTWAEIVSVSATTSQVAFVTSSGDVVMMNPEDGVYTNLPRPMGPAANVVFWRSERLWIELADGELLWFDKQSQSWKSIAVSSYDAHSLNRNDDLWVASGRTLSRLDSVGAILEQRTIPSLSDSSVLASFFVRNDTVLYAIRGDITIWMTANGYTNTIGRELNCITIYNMIELEDGSVLLRDQQLLLGIVHSLHGPVKDLGKQLGISWVTNIGRGRDQGGVVITLKASNGWTPSIIEIRSALLYSTVPVADSDVYSVRGTVRSGNHLWLFYAGGARDQFSGPYSVRYAGYVDPAEYSSSSFLMSWSLIEDVECLAFSIGDSTFFFHEGHIKYALERSPVVWEKYGPLRYIVARDSNIFATGARGILNSNDYGRTWSLITKGPFGRLNRPVVKGDTIIEITADSLYHTRDGVSWSSQPGLFAYDPNDSRLSDSTFAVAHGWGLDIYSLSHVDSTLPFRYPMVYDRPRRALLQSSADRHSLLVSDAPDKTTRISHGVSIVTLGAFGVLDSTHLRLPGRGLSIYSKLYGTIIGDTLVFLDLKQEVLYRYVADTLLSANTLPNGTLLPFRTLVLSDPTKVTFHQSNSFTVASTRVPMELDIMIGDSVWPTSVVDEVLFAQIHRAYPVPASNMLTVDLGFLSEAGTLHTLSLHSIDGRLLVPTIEIRRPMRQDERYTCSISVQDVPSGPALLVIGDGRSKHAMVVSIMR